MIDTQLSQRLFYSELAKDKHAQGRQHRKQLKDTLKTSLKCFQINPKHLGNARTTMPGVAAPTEVPPPTDNSIAGALRKHKLPKFKIYPLLSILAEYQCPTVSCSSSTMIDRHYYGVGYFYRPSLLTLKHLNQAISSLSHLTCAVIPK